MHPGDPDLLDVAAAFRPLLPPICVTQKPVHTIMVEQQSPKARLRTWYLLRYTLRQGPSSIRHPVYDQADRAAKLQTVLVFQIEPFVLPGTILVDGIVMSPVLAPCHHTNRPKGLPQKRAEKTYRRDVQVSTVTIWLSTPSLQCYYEMLQLRHVCRSFINGDAFVRVLPRTSDVVNGSFNHMRMAISDARDRFA